MKSKLILSLGLLAAPIAVLATSPEKAYIESYHTHASGPVPTFVVTPRLSSEFAGQHVTLEFVVDREGMPSRIRSVTPGADPHLVSKLSGAMAWWRFDPALVDGKPKARKVVLPVNVVAPSREGPRAG